MIDRPGLKERKAILLAYMHALLQLGRHHLLWTYSKGIFVVVLHFDHLFQAQSNHGIKLFVGNDFILIKKRIDRLFRFLAFFKSIMRLHCSTFDELSLC